MKTSIPSLVMALAATLVAAGCYSNPSKQDVGMVTGAVVGGIVGSDVTGGSTAGTVAGAAAGGYLGNRVGKSLEH